MKEDLFWEMLWNDFQDTGVRGKELKEKRTKGVARGHPTHAHTPTHNPTHPTHIPTHTHTNIPPTHPTHTHIHARTHIHPTHTPSHTRTHPHTRTPIAHTHTPHTHTHLHTQYLEHTGKERCKPRMINKMETSRWFLSGAWTRLTDSKNKGSGKTQVRAPPGEAGPKTYKNKKSIPPRTKAVPRLVSALGHCSENTGIARFASLWNVSIKRQAG